MSKEKLTDEDYEFSESDGELDTLKKRKPSKRLSKTKGTPKETPKETTTGEDLTDEGDKPPGDDNEPITVEGPPTEAAPTTEDNGETTQTDKGNTPPVDLGDDNDDDVEMKDNVVPQKRKKSSVPSTKRKSAVSKFSDRLLKKDFRLADDENNDDNDDNDDNELFYDSEFEIEAFNDPKITGGFYLSTVPDMHAFLYDAEYIDNYYAIKDNTKRLSIVPKVLIEYFDTCYFIPLTHHNRAEWIDLIAGIFYVDNTDIRKAIVAIIKPIKTNRFLGSLINSIYLLKMGDILNIVNIRKLISAGISAYLPKNFRTYIVKKLFSKSLDTGYLNLLDYEDIAKLSVSWWDNPGRKLVTVRKNDVILPSVDDWIDTVTESMSSYLAYPDLQIEHFPVIVEHLDDEYRQRQQSKKKKKKHKVTFPGLSDPREMSPPIPSKPSTFGSGSNLRTTITSLNRSNVDDPLKELLDDHDDEIIDQIQAKNTSTALSGHFDVKILAKQLKLLGDKETFRSNLKDNPSLQKLKSEFGEKSLKHIRDIVEAMKDVPIYPDKPHQHKKSNNDDDLDVDKDQISPDIWKIIKNDTLIKDFFNKNKIQNRVLQFRHRIFDIGYQLIEGKKFKKYLDESIQVMFDANAWASLLAKLIKAETKFIKSVKANTVSALPLQDNISISKLKDLLTDRINRNYDPEQRKKRYKRDMDEFTSYVPNTRLTRSNNPPENLMDKFLSGDTVTKQPLNIKSALSQHISSNSRYTKSHGGDGGDGDGDDSDDSDLDKDDTEGEHRDSYMSNRYSLATSNKALIKKHKCNLPILEKLYKLKLNDALQAFGISVMVNTTLKNRVKKNIKHIISFRYYYSGQKFLRFFSTAFSPADYLQDLLRLSGSFEFEASDNYWADDEFRKSCFLALFQFKRGKFPNDFKDLLKLNAKDPDLNKIDLKNSEFGWAGIAADIFDSIIPNQSTLDYLLDPTDSKSNIRTQLREIKTDNRQLAPLYIYKLAAASLPSKQKKKILAIFKAKGPVDEIAWRCMIIPTMIVASYYGLLRNVSTRNEFIAFIISLLAVVKSFYKIPAITPKHHRANIVYAYVSNILKGDYPLKAFTAATKNKDIDGMLTFDIDKFVIDKTDTDLVPRRIKNSRSNTNNKSNNNNNKKKPIPSNPRSYSDLTDCRKCGILVRKSNIKNHLTKYCSEREKPPR